MRQGNDLVVLAHPANFTRGGLYSQRADEVIGTI